MQKLIIVLARMISFRPKSATAIAAKQTRMQDTNSRSVAIYKKSTYYSLQEHSSAVTSSP